MSKQTTTTFESVRLMDKVWSPSLGWGKVTQTIDGDSGVIGFRVAYEGVCKNELYFLINGRQILTNGTTAPNQGVFWDEIKMVAPTKPIIVPPKDTKVLVQLSTDTTKYKRHTTGKIDDDGKLECYNDGLSSFTTNNSTSHWTYWEVVE